MQDLEGKTITLPNFGNLFKGLFTWKNGFLLLAAVLAVVAVYNFSIVKTRSYTAADGTTDMTALLMDQVMAYLPGAGAALIAIVASFFGVKPELISAIVAWSKNPEIASIEMRATTAVLQWLAAIYKDKPSIAAVISNLAQEIAKHQFPTPSEPTPAKPTTV